MIVICIFRLVKNAFLKKIKKMGVCFGKRMESSGDEIHITNDESMDDPIAVDAFLLVFRHHMDSYTIKRPNELGLVMEVGIKMIECFASITKPIMGMMLNQFPNANATTYIELVVKAHEHKCFAARRRLELMRPIDGQNGVSLAIQGYAQHGYTSQVFACLDRGW
jgi:hypothetical protein